MDKCLSWRWDLERVAEFIASHDFKRITLQFPDNLLHDAPLVADALQQHVKHLGANVYVLADTTYNPLGVDEVAAQHINADCVVHFGYASLHPVSRLPALCILPKEPLEVPAASTWLAQQLHANLCSLGVDQSSCGTAVILTDQASQHLLPELQQAMQLAYQGPLRLVFAQPAATDLWPAAAAPTATPPMTGGAPAPASASSSSPVGTESTPALPNQQPSQQEQQQQQQGQQHEHRAQTLQSARPPAPVVGCINPAQVGGLLMPWLLPADNNNSSHTAGSSSGSNNGAAAGTSTSCCTAAPKQEQQQQQGSAGPPDGTVLVYVGPLKGSPALTELQLSYSSCTWLLLDPATQQVGQGLSSELQRLLKKRYYLVERTKGAQLVGLLVGTLGAAGYRQVLARLQQLVKEAGKRSYTLLMGKPNPAKLANFPEIEVFVMVADAQGLLLDCKEYLAPIITPWEAYLAFTGQSLQLPYYRLDYTALFEPSSDSCATAAGADGPASGSRAQFGGNIVEDEEEVLAAETGVGDAGLTEGISVGLSSMSLTVKGSSQLVNPDQSSKQLAQARTAAEYLTQHRSFQGVETPATGAELKPAGQVVQGRSGRAAGYVDEPVG